MTMKRERAVLVLFLVVAAIVGFGLGWWLRDRSDDSVERRIQQAAEHIRQAGRSLTR